MPETDYVKKEQVEARLLIASEFYYLGYPEGSFEIMKKGIQLSKEIGHKRALAGFYDNFSLYYSFKGDPLKEIFSFLGISSWHELTSPLKKINPDRLSDIIENYDEVVEIIKKSPYAFCLNNDF